MFFRKKKNIEVKKWHWWFLLLLILTAFVFKGYAAYWPKAVIKINEQELKVLVADTADHRYRGWSGKKDMGSYDGMLFVYPNLGQHTMVMRKMNFPLDIIWLKNLQIIDIAPNVMPENKNTEAEYAPYFARTDSNLVLEMPAGFALENNLKIGDKIEILK